MDERIEKTLIDVADLVKTGQQAAVAQESKTATATFISKAGKESGTAKLTGTDKGVLIEIDVSGLPPSQWVAFHVHETGSCEHAGGHMSAGGHFNPAGKPHGQISMPDHHAGDMNNLTADSAGNARAQFLMQDVTVGAGPNSVVGRAVVVHKDPDDYRTQPTGNAGGRIACGVIAAS